jgi:hypothetical protein
VVGTAIVVVVEVDVEVKLGLTMPEVSKVSWGPVSGGSW